MLLASKQPYLNCANISSEKSEMRTAKSGSIRPLYTGIVVARPKALSELWVVRRNLPWELNL